NTGQTLNPIGITDDAPGCGLAHQELAGPTCSGPPIPIQSVSVSPSGWISCAVIGSSADPGTDLICNNGALADGQSATITIVQLVAANMSCDNSGTSGIFTNTATIGNPSVDAPSNVAVGTSTLAGCTPP